MSSTSPGMSISSAVDISCSISAIGNSGRVLRSAGSLVPGCSGGCIGSGNRGGALNTRWQTVDRKVESHGGHDRSAIPRPAAPRWYAVPARERRAGFRWDPSYGKRASGVMPLGGPTSEIRWVEIDPCFVFHGVSAHRDIVRIVMDVCVLPQAAEATPTGDSVPHRWTIGWRAARAALRTKVLTGRPMDLPAIDRRTGRANRRSRQYLLTRIARRLPGRIKASMGRRDDRTGSSTSTRRGRGCGSTRVRRARGRRRGRAGSSPAWDRAAVRATCWCSARGGRRPRRAGPPAGPRTGSRRLGARRGSCPGVNWTGYRGGHTSPAGTCGSSPPWRDTGQLLPQQTT